MKNVLNAIGASVAKSNLASKAVMSIAKKADIKRPGCAINIMQYCKFENGKLISPVNGKVIGWFNPNTCVGWCDPDAYAELLDYIESHPLEADEVDEADDCRYYGDEYDECDYDYAYDDSDDE